MEDYTDLLDQVEKALEQVNLIGDVKEQANYIEENFQLFFSFKNEINSLLESYQFKEPNNKEQIEKSKQLKNIICNFLRLDDKIFEINTNEISYFSYFKYEILATLSQNEGAFAYKLQFDDSLDKLKIANEYLEDRNDYIEAIQSIYSDEMTKGQADSYINNHFISSVVSHSLMSIKRNFKNMSKEDIIEVVSLIDQIPFIDELKKYEGFNGNNFYSTNLIAQYTETILRLKSVFTPEKIQVDPVFEAFWNGDVKDPKTIKRILKKLSIKSLNIKESENERFDIIESFVKHFKAINMTDENIADIIDNLMDKNLSYYCIADFLVKIGLPKNLIEFEKSEEFEEYKWLLHKGLFEKLKSKEKKIDNAYDPYLPVEYYVKKIENHDYTESFIYNLRMLLQIDFYDEKEKETLKKCLEKNGLNIREDLHNENDATDNFIKENYYDVNSCSEKDINDIMNRMLSSYTSDNDKTTKLMKIVIKSIIVRYLNKQGIDIKGQVYFGKSEKSDGYFGHPTNCIWINDKLIREFIISSDIETKKNLLNVMFHEMRHAIQQDDINKGNIDYLTYCFVKEEIIREYDEEFYNENYISIFKESDARREGIVGYIEFLKGINSKLVEDLRLNAESEFEKETERHTIYNDSQKIIKLGSNKVGINISDYVGKLIKENPSILANNTVLLLEYNLDGSQKDLETLLKEFNAIKSQNSNNYTNIYSIYYGLILDAISREENAEKFQSQLRIFFQEQSELVTDEDMQILYKKVSPLETSKVYERLYSLTRNIGQDEIKIPKGGETPNDNNSR